MALADGELKVAGLEKSTLAGGQAVLIDARKDLLGERATMQPCACRRGTANSPKATSEEERGRILIFWTQNEWLCLGGGEIDSMTWASIE